MESIRDEGNFVYFPSLNIRRVRKMASTYQSWEQYAHIDKCLHHLKMAFATCLPNSTDGIADHITYVTCKKSCFTSQLHISSSPNPPKRQGIK